MFTGLTLDAALKVLGKFWYAIPIAALLAALFITRHTLADARSHQHAAEDHLVQVLSATKQAANNPRLILRDVVAQINLLGSGMATLRAGLNTCNTSAHAAAARDAELESQAAAALASARAGDAQRQSLIDRLRSSAAHPAPAGTCNPSSTLQEIWR